MNKKNILILMLVLLAGSYARLFVSDLGFGYDMESWDLIARSVAEGKSMYTTLNRYNYGPVWGYVLYFLKGLTSGQGTEAFHHTVAAFLTTIDILITLTLRKYYGLLPAVVFFLCPISILITGYHSQFDNVAVFLGLVSWVMLKKTRWLLPAALFMGLSLSTKHVLAFFPFWVLTNGAGSKRRRWTFFFVSLGFFALSFVPWLVSPIIRPLVIQNVFQYDSFPKDALFTNVIHFISPFASLTFIKGLFILLMCISGKFVKSSLDLFAVYLLTLIVFSPGAMDEYLAIPLVGIAIYYRHFFAQLYYVAASFLVASSHQNVGGLERFRLLSDWNESIGLKYYHVTLVLLALLMAISFPLRIKKVKEHHVPV